MLFWSCYLRERNCYTTSACGRFGMFWVWEGWTMCRHELLIRWSMQPFQLVPFLRLVDCSARLVFLFPLPSITHLLYAGLMPSFCKCTGAFPCCSITTLYLFWVGSGALPRGKITRILLKIEAVIGFSIVAIAGVARAWVISRDCRPHSGYAFPIRCECIRARSINTNSIKGLSPQWNFLSNRHVLISIMASEDYAICAAQYITLQTPAASTCINQNLRNSRSSN